MRTALRRLPPLIALAGLAPASAQCTSSWNILLGTIPVGRQNPTIVYDAARGRVTLFGGLDSLHFEFLADTWVLNGQDWVQTNIGGAAPSAREAHAMVYDSARQRIILFGGFDGARQNDTWEWNGAAWSLVPASNPPAARQSHAMAYDSARQRVVVFGGTDTAGALLGDTWEYDPAAAAWHQITPAAAPSARADSAMVFDASRGRCVLFGGQDSVGPNGDTWEWNGTGWTPFLVAAPDARYGHAMTYDDARHVCVLFGGSNFTSLLNDTWERSGTAWTDVTPAASPSPRYYHAMAFDPGPGAAVVYAGSNGNGPFMDTWERACGGCYPNCDASTVSPILNVGDFICFLNRFAAQDPYANCDGSTTPPTLNVLDFTCFLNRFAAGC